MERSGSPATDAPADALAKAAAEAATDRTLVARVREGDSQAFSALVQRHMRAAFAIAYHVLQHREDAEDAVQQAFVTALLRLDLYDAARPFGPWFARVVLNHARTARRARRRTAQRSVDHLDRLEASPLASPHRAAEDAEVRERVRAAVAMLPDRQRLAVQLVDVEGYAPSEVAGMLDLSPVTVRWHLMAARRTLRRLLAPLAPLPPLPPLPPLTEAAPPPRQGRGR